MARFVALTVGHGDFYLEGLVWFFLWFHQGRLEDRNRPKAGGFSRPGGLQQVCRSPTPVVWTNLYTMFLSHKKVVLCFYNV